MRIIPAVNATSFDEAMEVMKKTADFSDWIHIDVVDGKFAPNVTWGDPDDFLNSNFDTRVSNLFVEVHLMVERPEDVVEKWLKARAKRIIVHIEAIRDVSALDLISNQCKEFGAELMLASKPDTSTEDLAPYLIKADLFQFLAVNPGRAGQKFQPAVIDKIKFLRERRPDAIIEIDGGVNAETARLAKEAGADIAVSASYIWENNSPKEAYEKLQRI